MSSYSDTPLKTTGRVFWRGIYDGGANAGGGERSGSKVPVQRSWATVHVPYLHQNAVLLSLSHCVRSTVLVAPIDLL